MFVEGYHELLALHRGLMEVRYLADVHDPAIRGSAFLSALHVRVLDAMIEQDEIAGRFGAAQRWREWRTFREQDPWVPAILEELSRGWTKDLSSDEKRARAALMIQPFTYREDQLRVLIEGLDARHEQTGATRPADDP